MPRVKRGTVRRAKRKKLLGLAKGYYASKSKLYRSAKEAVDTALKYAFVGRRNKKRDFRRLWIVRINAAAREHGPHLRAADARAEDRRHRDRSEDARRPRGQAAGGVRQGRRAGEGRARHARGRISVPARRGRPRLRRSERCAVDSGQMARCPPLTAHCHLQDLPRATFTGPSPSRCRCPTSPRLTACERSSRPRSPRLRPTRRCGPCATATSHARAAWSPPS